jgi:two-component system sensor histidine kinase MtrB
VTAAFGAGAALVSASLAFTTFVVVHHDLLSQRQSSSLRQAYVNARLVKQELEAPSGDVAGTLLSLAPAAGVRALIYRHGLWFSTSTSVGHEGIPASLTKAVLAGNAAEQRISLNGRPSFAIGIPIPSIGVDYFEIHSLADVQNTIETLGVVLFLTAVATTIGGGLIGLWASRRLVRPLSDIAVVASEIAGGALDRRLEYDPDLGTLAVAFNDMVNSLQQRIERDARFAADLSHELRSPLTSVGASVEIVEWYRAVLPLEGQTAIDLLKFEVDRFSVMVQDLLAISLMDSGAAVLPLEPVPIDTLVSLIIARYDGLQLTISAEAKGALVMGDKRRLQQVMTNLLNNAEAHAGGPVLVAVIRTGSWVEIAVEDAGPGIGLTEQQHVFERFYRGAASGRRGATSGAGLGLALVAEHVRTHRGIIRVENRLEGGARFVVALPVVDS